MELRATGTADELINQYSALLSKCFPMAHHFDCDYLRWLYSENPDGPVVGFDAWEGSCLAAHYVTIPAPMRVNGTLRKALLSLNTATHPAYQGQGLFTKLAEQTYRSATDQGFECVYGIANANSTPGFQRRLGFTLVGQLDARIGIGRLTRRAGGVQQPDGLRRAWNAASLAWRFRNPKNPVRAEVIEGTTMVAATSARLPVLSAWAEVPALPDFIPSGPAPRTLGRLFLGKLSAAERGTWQFVDIPHRLRPSPLNLIFRDVAGNGDVIDMAQVSLNFLDFDAY